MPSSCAPVQDVYDAATVAAYTDRPSAPGHNSLFDQHREAVRVQQLIDDLRSHMAPQDTQASNQYVSKLQKQKIDMLAGKYMELLHLRAKDGELERKAYTTSLLNSLAGNNATTLSWQARLVNTMGEKFLDERSKLHAWAATTFPQEGIALRDHPIVSALNAIDARTSGIAARLGHYVTEMQKAAQPIAERTGHNVDDLLFAAGSYANALHALESNPRIRAELETMFNDANAKLRTLDPDSQEYKALYQTANELHHRIQRYDQFKNVNRFEKMEKKDRLATDAHYAMGMNNREAIDLMRFLQEQYGLSDAEFKELAMHHVRFAQGINGVRAEFGMVSPEEIASHVPDRWYVMSSSRHGNAGGAINSGAASSPLKNYRMRGMVDVADSAYYTLVNRAHRVASDVGLRDIGLALNAAFENGGGNYGLIRVDINKLNAFKNSPNQRARLIGERAQARFGNGGFEVEVDNPNPDGPKKIRYLIGFDRDYVNENLGVTGEQLNQAIISQARDLTGLGGLVTKMTSMYGQTLTRFRPWWTPKNFLTDGMERIMHIAGQAHYNENGELLNPMRLVTSFVGNTADATKLMWKANNGTLDRMSGRGRFVKEFEDMGIRQIFTKGMIDNRVSDAQKLEKLYKAMNAGADSPIAGSIYANNSPPVQNRVLDPRSFKPKGPLPESGYVEEFIRRYPSLKSGKEVLSKVGKPVLDFLDKQWNDSWNNAAPLAHYITLREAGMSAREAGNAVLASMNLYQRGKYTGALQFLAPFVKPAAQTAANMARIVGLSLGGDGRLVGLNRHGMTALIGAGLGSLMFANMQEAAWGDDPETGESRILGFSPAMLTNSILLPVNGPDGAPLKIPTGFGWNQVAQSLIWNMKKVEAGRMSPLDAAKDVMFTTVKNVYPANWAEFDFGDHPAEFLTQALTPIWARPFVDPAMKLNHWGRPTDMADPNSWDPKALQGQLRTPAIYHSIANGLLKMFGMDVTPETVQSFISNILPGSLSIIRNGIEKLSATAPGRNGERTSTLGQLMLDLGGSAFFAKSGNTNQNVYYMLQDKYKHDAKALGVKLTGMGRGNDKAENLRQAVLDAGGSEDLVNKILLIQQAERDLRKISKDFKALAKPLWNSASTTEELDELFKNYAEQKNEVYVRAINALDGGGR